MPAEREPPPPQKRRRLPFNPPRPRASPSAGPSTTTTEPNQSQKNTKKRTTASSSKPRTSTSSARREPSQTPISSSPESSPRNRSRNREPEPEPESEERESSPKAGIREDEADYILAEITHNNRNHDGEEGAGIHSSTPTVPPKLLTRLLTHNFQDPKTKIAKDANGVVAKYVDVFVREALARAAYETGEGRAEGRGIADGFLEVEDLEKMGPQLVLDF